MLFRSKVTRDYIRLIVEVVSDNSDDNVEAQDDDGGSELGSVVGENFWFGETPLVKPWPPVLFSSLIQPSS